MQRVLGLVVCLPREASRQVRIVPVLVQLALRIRQQLPRLPERNGRVTLHPRPFRVLQQATRLAEVPVLDRHQLGFAI
jgi:hypothetical protein